MSEPAVDQFDASISTLFSNIDNYLKEENERDRLEWVNDIGWSSEIVSGKTDPENFASALKVLGKTTSCASERHCYDLLKFLFSTLADAVRDEGR